MNVYFERQLRVTLCHRPHYTRAQAVADEITARLAEVSFALPGTLADHMTRCGCG